MQELVGVMRKAIKIIAQIIPTFNHYICTYFGISNQKYGRELDQLVGNSQGNIFTGVACRDQSCREFKEIENEKLGAIFIAPHTKKERRPHSLTATTPIRQPNSPR